MVSLAYRNDFTNVWGEGVEKHYKNLDFMFYSPHMVEDYFPHITTVNPSSIYRAHLSPQKIFIRIPNYHKLKTTKFAYLPRLDIFVGYI